MIVKNDEDYLPLYSPLDKYVVVNGKLKRAYRNILDSGIYIANDPEEIFFVLTKEPLITRTEALEKYPEEFI